MTRSKRGSTMVEAAIVFPLVILSIAAVIFMMIAMYGYVSQSAGLHVSLIERAGAESETYEVSPVSAGDNSLNKDGKKVKGAAFAESEGVIIGSGRKKIVSEKGIIREKDVIRKTDFVIDE